MKHLENSLDKIWFIYDGQVVKGPFDSAEISNGLKTEKFLGTELYWGREKISWEPLSHWNAAPGSLSDLWYLHAQGFNDGPFAIDTLIEKISRGDIPADCKLWTSGLNQWVSLYEAPEFLEALHISRRRHERAPFVGAVRIEGVETSILNPVTVSVGGLGLRFADGGETFLNDEKTLIDFDKDASWDVVPDELDFTKTFAFEPDLSIGREVAVHIESPFLEFPLNVVARVVYHQGENIGLAFTSVSDEARMAVSAYVNRYQSSL